jgi:hypothetical protein
MKPVRIKANTLLMGLITVTEHFAGSHKNTHQNVFDVRSLFSYDYTERNNRAMCFTNEIVQNAHTVFLSLNSTAQTDAFAATPTLAQNSSPYEHEKSILAPVILPEFQSSPPSGVL